MARTWTLALMMLVTAPSLSGCWMGEQWAKEAAEREQARREGNDAQVQAWIKRSSSDLVAELGPPAQIIDDASGVKIYVFTQETVHSEDGTSDSYQDDKGHVHTTTTAPQVWTEHFHRMFWVDKKGTVVRATWKED